ncbi:MULTISPECIES: AraC family transcriptional regulator [Burkholderia]|uniref:AraC family transcriptional regulator n=2 Tax=Burkholderia aenigmatica TaxID=2015348 RepID=A0A6J5IY78_9BURK|nr:MULTISPECIES: AraC family transcriptional regulator [Burkholderia]CAB3963899.1 AraC family transcriptional regulator [Burkholderia aenigmatica]
MVLAAMESEKPVWILQGEFGRATVNFISRPLVAHAHSQYQFLFKLGGSDCDFRLGAEDCTLSADSAICLNPWVEHAKCANKNTPSLILSLVIEPPWLRKRLGLADGSPADIFPRRIVVVTPDVQHHVDRLAAAITNHLVAQDAGCLPILEDLITALGRDFADPELTTRIAPSTRPVDFRIRKALDFIKRTPSANATVTQVASEVGLSRSRFFEQFRRCMGISPQHYIDWVRMSHAIRLLAESDRPLADIADELGFEEHSHFTRFFAQHMGVPPSDFRRHSVTLDLERFD